MVLFPKLNDFTLDNVHRPSTLVYLLSYKNAFLVFSHATAFFVGQHYYMMEHLNTNQTKQEMQDTAVKNSREYY